MFPACVQHSGFWADLPHEDTEAIRMVVPPVGLDLGVLAQHVEAQALGHLQVVDQGLVCGGRVDAVWPVALQCSSQRSYPGLRAGALR